MRNISEQSRCVGNTSLKKPQGGISCTKGAIRTDRFFVAGSEDEGGVVVQSRCPTSHAKLGSGSCDV